MTSSRHTDWSSSKVTWIVTGITVGFLFFWVWLFYQLPDTPPAPPPAPPPVTQAELTPCRTIAATKRVIVYDCDGVVFSQRKEKK